jgi:hypothetical protein
MSRIFGFLRGKSPGKIEVTWSLLALPIIFSSYPVIALLANNVGEVPLTQGLPPLFVSIIGAMVLFGLLLFIVRSGIKASLLSVMILIAFFSYGHIYSFVKDWQISGVLIGRHRYLLPLFFITLTGAAVWILRTSRRLEALLSTLRVVGVVALVFPIITIGNFLLQESQIENQDSASSTSLEDVDIDMENLPDVYYIIVDGYGRQDILLDLYGYDNEAFIGFLESQGFYVADQSMSNYVQTILSLPSSLNLGYLQNLNLNLLPDSRFIGGLSDRLQQSVVRSTLEELGYITVAFQTGSWPINVKDADIFYEPIHLDVASTGKGISWSNFDILLTETTVIRAYNDLAIAIAESEGRDLRYRSYQAQRDRILSTLYRLESMAEVEGPKYVYAHIVCPHPPFVFGRNGEELPHSVPYTIKDGDHFMGSREDYIKLYIDQLIFLNNRLTTIIERIIADSDTSPIIIIQGDHGPGAYLVWDSPEETIMRERFSILNAYYVPEDVQDLLYPTISPVNSFRLIFNQVFGLPYELLPDEHYYSTHANPFDFISVTEALREE